MQHTDFSGAMRKIQAQQTRVQRGIMALQLEGSICVQEIHNRTLTGIDAELRLFERYSKPYLAYKAKKDRYNGYVNLTFNSQMLRAMKAFPYDKGFEIRFINETERVIAKNHNYGETVPKRHFFAFDRNQKKRLIMKISQIMGAYAGGSY